MWVIIRPLIHSIKGTFHSNILPYFLIKNMHVFVAVMTDMSDSAYPSNESFNTESEFLFRDKYTFYISSVLGIKNSCRRCHGDAENFTYLSFILKKKQIQ